MDPYADLGVARDADRDTIRRAYRKRAQKAHPDRQGGSESAFRSIQKAYDILGDDARRAHFDRHGADNTQDRRSELFTNLAALFFQSIAAASSLDHTDIFATMRAGLKEGRKQREAAIAANRKSMKKFEGAIRRVQKKGGGVNVFADMLRGQVSQGERAIAGLEEEIGKGAEMLALLDEYAWAVEKGQAPTTAYARYGSFGNPINT